MHKDMVDQQQIQTINHLILVKYGSLDEPKFFFKKESVAQDPYRPVVGQIKEHFHVKEVTDLNADASFQYELEKEGKLWNLVLSMIGPYAAVLRIVIPAQSIQVIDPLTTPLVEVERSLMEVILRNGIQVLNEATLTYPVPLTLNYTNPGNVRVYQALFGDYDVLPWIPYRSHNTEPES